MSELGRGIVGIKKRRETKMSSSMCFLAHVSNHKITIEGAQLPMRHDAGMGVFRPQFVLQIYKINN